MTDCMDLFELVCSKKGLNNDTSQRVVILSLREFRALGIIRALVHVPTVAMLADGLTKIGKFPQLMKFCTTGVVPFTIKDELNRLPEVLLRRDRQCDGATERELWQSEWSLAGQLWVHWGECNVS